MDQRIAIVVVALRTGFPSRAARHFYGAATLSVDLSIKQSVDESLIGCFGSLDGRCG